MAVPVFGGADAAVALLVAFGAATVGTATLVEVGFAATVSAGFGAVVPSAGGFTVGCAARVAFVDEKVGAVAEAPLDASVGAEATTGAV